MNETMISGPKAITSRSKEKFQKIEIEMAVANRNRNALPRGILVILYYW